MGLILDIKSCILLLWLRTQEKDFGIVRMHFQHVHLIECAYRVTKFQCQKEIFIQLQDMFLKSFRTAGQGCLLPPAEDIHRVLKNTIFIWGWGVLAGFFISFFFYQFMCQIYFVQVVHNDSKLTRVHAYMSPHPSTSHIIAC